MKSYLILYLVASIIIILMWYRLFGRNDPTVKKDKGRGVHMGFNEGLWYERERFIAWPSKCSLIGIPKRQLKLCHTSQLLHDM